MGQLTFTLEHAVYKVTLVVRAVLPLVAALPVFLARDIVALELDFALVPGLTSVTVLQIVRPFTFVSGALRVYKRAVAVGHAVLPLTLVGVAVSLGHAALASHLIVLELAFITGSISPC